MNVKKGYLSDCLISMNEYKKYEQINGGHGNQLILQKTRIYGFFRFFNFDLMVRNYVLAATFLAGDSAGN